MIRGWRNDPRWVEFYKQRDLDRLQREIQRMRLEAQEEFAKIKSDIGFSDAR